MNSTLFFKTLCFVCCISSLSFAQVDSVKNDNNYRSLWIGTEIVRSLIIFDVNANNALKNKAFEINVDYSITPTLRTYLYAGYASLQGRVRRNLDYWNESFYTRAGLKYSAKGRKGRVMAGVGLIYYALHETGGFKVGGPFFGDNTLFPYNFWSTGIGPEVVMDFRVPLFSNFELKFDLSVNLTFNPAFKDVKNDVFRRNRYYVPGIGLVTLAESPQYNINLGIGLIYRIDWLRKK